jgi:hypothetical protein
MLDPTPIEEGKFDCLESWVGKVQDRGGVLRETPCARCPPGRRTEIVVACT